MFSYFPRKENRVRDCNRYFIACYYCTFVKKFVVFRLFPNNAAHVRCNRTRRGDYRLSVLAFVDVPCTPIRIRLSQKQPLPQFDGYLTSSWKHRSLTVGVMFQPSHTTALTAPRKQSPCHIREFRRVTRLAVGSVRADDVRAFRSADPLSRPMRPERDDGPTYCCDAVDGRGMHGVPRQVSRVCRDRAPAIVVGAKGGRGRIELRESSAETASRDIPARIRCDCRYGTRKTADFKFGLTNTSSSVPVIAGKGPKETRHCLAA